MNRALFRLFLLSATFVTLAFFVEFLMARGKEGGKTSPSPPSPSTDVRYRVNWISGPNEATSISPRDFILTTDENGIPVSALVVGHYSRTDRTSSSGFIYDVLGSIDPDSIFADPDPNNPNDPIPNKFWDVEDLVGPTPYASFFRGVNSAGLVAGYIIDPSGERHAVYIRLNAEHLELSLIPDAISPSRSNYAAEVTEFGDILIHVSLGGVAYEAFVYVPDTGSMTPILNSSSNPIQSHGSWPNLSSMRDFIGLRPEDIAVFRHSIVTGQTEVFPNLLSYVPDCNELGEFVSGVTIPSGRNRYKVHAIRVGTNGSTWVGIADTQGVAINDEGDVLIEQYPDNGFFSYFHQGLQQTIKLNDLIIAESDPNRWFRDAGGYGYTKMSNRDATGFGWITCGVNVPQLDGSTRQVMALLIPEIVVPPTTHTYSRTHSPPLVILDNGTVTSSIVVSDNFAIADLNVTLTINHQRAQDMDVFLIAPNGTRVELFTDVGGNGLNFVGTTLDSQATTSITSGSAPFTGTYRPERSLSAFNDLSTLGTWELEVTDDKATKTGTLQNWSFTVEVN